MSVTAAHDFEATLAGGPVVFHTEHEPPGAVAREEILHRLRALAALPRPADARAERDQRCAEVAALGADSRSRAEVSADRGRAAHLAVADVLGEAESLSQVQAAFHQLYAAQCGFCTPGMIVAATALIERKGGPVEREDVVDALGGHYCRCTGYVKIVDAVLAASRGEAGSIKDLPVAVAGQPEVEPKGSPA